MTETIPRLRSRERIAREEYALSPKTLTGLVLGRPVPGCATRISSSRSGSILPSCPCPGATITASGRPRPSTAWWILVDSPPRERPIP